jgi:hypothetical protein
MTAGLAETLERHGFLVRNEAELQDAIAEILTAAGAVVEREVRLTSYDRIDLLVGRVGIEVKVAGQPADVERQIRRYAESPLVDSLILVTTRHRHAVMPQQMNGKAVTVIVLRGGF